MQSISPGSGSRASFHQRTALLVGAVILLTGAMAQSLAQPKIEFEQYQLSNGLSVVLHEDHTSPVVATMVMYHVGSKNEKVKRTGFAHLFEHIMFKGSEHVADGEHFKLLQEVGANINGSTTEDRTNYFEVVPSNYLELALYLESDRMGFLLPALGQQKLDNQRDVVKNERRQNYDNQPYGTAHEKIAKALFPEGHPYSWPVIGYMDDLSAASLQDVKDFFSVYYAPNNAVLVLAGDFAPQQAREWITKYFGPIPRGKEIERPKPQPAHLAAEKRFAYEDKVQLPRLYLTWGSAPRDTREDAVLDVFTDIMSVGKNSRLYRSLVFEKQIAQSVQAYQDGSEIAGTLGIVVTAKPGHTLKEMEDAVQQEIARVLNEGVSEKEIQTSLNNKEAQLVNRLMTVLGKSDALASYYTYTGDAGNINKEFQRYAGITPEELRAVVSKTVTAPKVVLSVVPEGKLDLAAQSTPTRQKEDSK